MSLSTFESELLTEWLTEMQKNEDKYKEPILDSSTSSLIKTCCTVLNQDLHVFVRAVDTLEEYISRKDALEQEITDPILIVQAIIFISSKYCGDQELKAQYIESLLRTLTGAHYSPKSIKLQEIEILTTLDNMLPLSNKVDDLNTFVVKFEKECKIKASVLPLSLDILEMLYLTKKEWFFKLKSVYAASNEALEVFKQLICSRFYLPFGILIYIFKYTAYNYSLNVDSILEDLANRSEIHVDHLLALVSKIHDVIEQPQVN